MSKLKSVPMTSAPSESMFAGMKAPPTKATGYGEVDLSPFEEVVSKDKSVFRVFATTPSGVKASIRFWKEASSLDETQLGFRVRFGDAADDHDVGYDPLFTKLWSVWTSASSGTHRSIQGALQVSRHAWEGPRVAQAVMDMGAPEQLANSLVHLVPELKFLTPSPLEFEKLIYDLIVVCLADIFNPTKHSSHKDSFTLGIAAAPVLKLRNGQWHSLNVKTLKSQIAATSPISQSSKDKDKGEGNAGVDTSTMSPEALAGL